VLLRLLLVGYLYGITSERPSGVSWKKLKMHRADRWFTAGLQPGNTGSLDFLEESARTLSPVRSVSRRVRGVVRDLAAGLVEGKNLAVDGAMVGANASRQGRVPRERLQEAAQVLLAGLTNRAGVSG
jgi:hypothetical protein